MPRFFIYIHRWTSQSICPFQWGETAEIIKEYNLDHFGSDRFLYFDIMSGMYRLPQSIILAKKLVEKSLKPFGFIQTCHTPGLWCNDTRPIQFLLVVENFRVQYRHTKVMQSSSPLSSRTSTSQFQKNGKENVSVTSLCIGNIKSALSI